ncbi:hypothetical protein ABIB40_003162 [Pedobacter sp. UYP30]|uniref:hypothetical protein n=1 Tax=Pedobacter sp. UYP30 TaxID=1756400 RepID=UPI0033990AF9
MTKILPFLLVALFAISGYAQTFEGKIVYRNAYKSKTPKMTNEQLTTMMGSAQEYFIKNGDYKSVTNGLFINWQLYVNKDNKLYSKLKSSETLIWNDASINTDKILKTEIHKNVMKILGYPCDELILTCKSGIQKYYFNKNLSVNPKLYIHHKFGNWYDVLSRSNSLLLKVIVETDQFSFVSVATGIKKMKLDESFFDLPKNQKTIRNLY